MVTHTVLSYDASSRIPRSGRSQSVSEWFDGLDPQAAAKITVALTRLAQGNFSSVKGVGSGVLEFRVDFGPGYRIYFGRNGQEFVILLAGGTKRRQQQDIETALARWT